MARSNRSKEDWSQSSLEIYLREINKTPLLTAQQEKELAYRIEKGDSEARDQMARANLRLVVNIARSYASRGLRSLHEYPLQHLRQLLDQAVDQTSAGEHGQDDSHSGLHGGALGEMASRLGQAADRSGPASVA